jgi:acyl-CoA reductase-like NAD-dependent aldehyde dehydrogenase
MQLDQRVVKFLNETKKLYIDGEFVEALNGETFDVVNPADETVLTKVSLGRKEDINKAVIAAREAFDHGSWKKMTPSERGRCLYRLADLMEEHKTALAQLETLDNGKPISETINADVPLAIDHFRYFAGWATKIVGQTIPVNGNYFNYTTHEPIGVVGQIIPWNFPLLMAAWKLGAALATGCTSVVKPASYTPLSVLYLASLFNDAGFPKGVINIVPGPGGETGDALVGHPLVNKIAFTGSTAVGMDIMKNASFSLKRVTLELGGKSPNIVMPGADLNKAVPGVLSGIMFNQGQVCCAGSRAFVHKSIYDEFLGEISRLADNLQVGNGLLESTNMGPLVSAKQQKDVLGHIKSGQEEGAVLRVGGNTLHDKGYFVQPTIFEAKNNMKISQNEIFGPVVTVIQYDSIEDMIKEANDNIYGLAAGIWTDDLREAHTVAAAIDAGTVWVNCYNVFDAAAPFGGYKQSGIGREMGSYALSNYTEVKDVWINLD